MVSQRDNIKELLIDEYWKEEADDIIDFALAQGYTLDEIAELLTVADTDVLIINSTWRTMARRLDA